MATFQKRNQNFNRPVTFKAHYSAVQLEEALLTITSSAAKDPVQPKIHTYIHKAKN